MSTSVTHSGLGTTEISNIIGTLIRTRRDSGLLYFNKILFCFFRNRRRLVCGTGVIVSIRGLLDLWQYSEFCPIRACAATRDSAECEGGDRAGAEQTRR